MTARIALVLVGAGIGAMVGMAAGEPARIGGALILLGAVVAVVSAVAQRRPTSAHSASSDEGWRAFEREIARARRFDHPLTLIRIALPGEVGRWFDRLAPSLREVDVAWCDPSAIWLAVPRADDTAVARMIARLMGETPELADVAIVRSASFPADALTAGGLVGSVLADGDRPVRLPVRAGDDGAISADVSDRLVGEAGQ